MRKNYLSWDEYFMMIAMLSAQRSKDPNTQIGACIVKNRRIVGTGYNGMPNGCPDSLMSWNRDGEDNKYLYVCHAEMNACINATCDTRGTTMYTNYLPCNECAKVIIQSGIKEVVITDEIKRDNCHFDATKKMFKYAGVEVRYIKSDNIEIFNNFISSTITPEVNCTNSPPVWYYEGKQYFFPNKDKESDVPPWFYNTRPVKFISDIGMVYMDDYTGVYTGKKLRM